VLVAELTFSKKNLNGQWHDMYLIMPMNQIRYPHFILVSLKCALLRNCLENNNEFGSLSDMYRLNGCYLEDYSKWTEINDFPDTVCKHSIHLNVKLTCSNAIDISSTNNNTSLSQKSLVYMFAFIKNLLFLSRNWQRLYDNYETRGPKGP